MDSKEAKKIKIGDRVQIWAERPDACTGTAIEVGYNAVKFEWDDGQIGIIHHNDMKDVARHCGEKIVPQG
jgi:hypothetical protein